MKRFDNEKSSAVINGSRQIEIIEFNFLVFAVEAIGELLEIGQRHK